MRRTHALTFLFLMGIMSLAAGVVAARSMADRPLAASAVASGGWMSGGQHRLHGRLGEALSGPLESGGYRLLAGFAAPIPSAPSEPTPSAETPVATASAETPTATTTPGTATASPAPGRTETLTPSPAPSQVPTEPITATPATQPPMPAPLALPWLGNHSPIR